LSHVIGYALKCVERRGFEMNISWQTSGFYECEYCDLEPTGWVRCVGGRLSDGR